MSNLAEAKPKEVKITLKDGVERTVRFTLNALAELEDAYGSVQAAFDKLEKENSMKALRKILWAGLLDESPDLTELKVGSLIDTTYMSQLMESLGATFAGDMPKNEGDASPNV